MNVPAIAPNGTFVSSVIGRLRNPSISSTTAIPTHASAAGCSTPLLIWIACPSANAADAKHVVRACERAVVTRCLSAKILSHERPPALPAALASPQIPRALFFRQPSPRKAMDSPLIRKLSDTEKRLLELQESLNDPAVLSNPTRLVAASKESGQLAPVVSKFREYKHAQKQLDDLREMSKDAEMAEMARAELPDAEAKATALLEELKAQCVAAQANAVDSFFVEARAGAAGGVPPRCAR